MQLTCHGLKKEDFQVEFINHEISLGSEESNSIAVEAEGISGRHAILTEDGGDLFIRDCGSTNGTLLNHKKITDRRKIASGDIIQLGSRMIRADFLSAQKVTLNFLSDDSVDVTAMTMMWMRSLVVVFPASMWAMMPILRTLSSG